MRTLQPRALLPGPGALCSALLMSAGYYNLIRLVAAVHHFETVRHSVLTLCLPAAGTRFRGREFGCAPIVASSRNTLAIGADGEVITWVRCRRPLCCVLRLLAARCC